MISKLGISLLARHTLDVATVNKPAKAFAPLRPLPVPCFSSAAPAACGPSEKTLSARFDVREFHDRVLESGCVPLKVLEQKIDRWISQKANG